MYWTTRASHLSRSGANVLFSHHHHSPALVSSLVILRLEESQEKKQIRRGD